MLLLFVFVVYYIVVDEWFFEVFWIDFEVVYCGEVLILFVLQYDDWVYVELVCFIDDVSVIDFWRECFVVQVDDVVWQIECNVFGECGGDFCQVLLELVVVEGLCMFVVIMGMMFFIVYLFVYVLQLWFFFKILIFFVMFFLLCCQVVIVEMIGYFLNLVVVLLQFEGLFSVEEVLSWVYSLF